MIRNEALVRAVLDGQIVQAREHNGHWYGWDDQNVLISWLVHPKPGMEFRRKPANVVHWCVVNKDEMGTDIPWAGGMSRDEAYAGARSELKAGKTQAAVLRIELDPDDLHIVDARTEIVKEQ